jgi:uncharacterized protein YcfL
MKKFLLLLSLFLLVSCSSTRQPDNTAYYKNYFSSVSLDNNTITPVPNDTPTITTDVNSYSSNTNYSDWGSNSTVSINYYNTTPYWYNSYFYSNNIYTNHWPYTNYIYSNDYYGFYYPYSYSHYYPTYYYGWYHTHYHPNYHNYCLGNVYSNGWGHRNTISTPRNYTSTYNNTPRNYNNSQPRSTYIQTPRNNNNTYNTPRNNNYNNNTYNTPRPTYNNTPRSYTPSYSSPRPTSSGGRSGGGRR